MLQKLCLQWDDFQDNIKTAFGKLREVNDFADVTLACEDGQQVEAHKVILASSSPFFQKLLKRNGHPHPLIYMRGVKSDDLLAIMDFLYNGEANVSQENLDSFLAFAEELQLKGLMDKTDFEADDKDLPLPFSQAITANANIPKTFFPILPCNRKQIPKPREKVSMTIPGNLEEMIKSMMEKSRNRIANGSRFADVCKVCGKEGFGRNIKDHIEANHLEGIVIPCSLCNKTFRSYIHFGPHNL